MDRLVYRWIDRKMHSSLGLGSQFLIWASKSTVPVPTDSVASRCSPDLLRNWRWAGFLTGWGNSVQ